MTTPSQPTEAELIAEVRAKFPDLTPESLVGRLCAALENRLSHPAQGGEGWKLLPANGARITRSWSWSADNPEKRESGVELRWTGEGAPGRNKTFEEAFAASPLPPGEAVPEAQPVLEVTADPPRSGPSDSERMDWLAKRALFVCSGLTVVFSRAIHDNLRARIDAEMGKGPDHG